jgi:hypothetical protein
METNTLNETPKIDLSKEALSNLYEMRKWTNFLAIMGFIFIGFMILIGFAIKSFLATMGPDIPQLPYSSTLIGFIYLMIGLLYFFPVLYLYKFSSWTKSALANNNSSDLNEAFKNLKLHYRFIGILTIITLVLYGVMFIAGIVIGFASAVS